MLWLLMMDMLLLIPGWTMGATWSSVISCGATLGPDAAYMLTADLTCPEPTPALTLLRGVTLDRAGHTLTAAGGIQLSGDEITIRQGTILLTHVYGVARSAHSLSTLMCAAVMVHGAGYAAAAQGSASSHPQS
jgi:hypothetical protein